MIEEKLNNIYKVTHFTHLEYKNKTEIPSNLGHENYGEVTRKGVEMLVEHFKEYFNENTIFYDLGSGMGKMVMHIALKYPVKAAYGIELSKERHAAALMLRKKYAAGSKNIFFQNRSIQQTTLHNASVVYLDNTSFTDRVCLEIYKKLPKNCLVIFKRNFLQLHADSHKVRREVNAIKVTYKQNIIHWVLK